MADRNLPVTTSNPRKESPMTALTKDCPGCGRQILTGRDRCIRCEVNKASRLVLGVATAAVLTAAVPSPAAPIEAASSAKQRPPGCRHPARPPADCARKHARLDRLGYPKCRRWRCVHKTRRVQFREERRAMRRCDQDHVRACIRRAAIHRGQDYGYMKAVAYCESRFNPYAANRSSGASGLFQFLPSTWQTTPYGHRSIFSAKWSSLAAGWMWQQGRIGEWSCA